MDLTGLARFHIAPGGDPADPDGWVWQNRSADVNHRGSGLSISGGRGDEISQVNASTLAIEVDNAGGHYCTRNPNGRWSGLLSRNCPARWGTISGAAAFTTNATNGWGVPDVGTSWTLEGTASTWSAASGTGQRAFATANLAGTAMLNGADARDRDATWISSLSVIATGGPMIYAFVARATGLNDSLLFCCELSTSGSISAKIRRQVGGSFTTIATNEPLATTYTAGMRIKSRAQWIGPNLRLKIWREADPEPDAWTLTTTDNVIQGSAVGLYLWRFSANTNAGTLSAVVDDLQIEAIEVVGTISEFPVRWDPTAAVSWVPLQISGITRRLSQGAAAVRSPMYRNITGYTRLIGYWPMEDGSGSTQLTNALPGGIPGSLIGMELGGDGPAGSAGAARFTNNSGLSKIGGVFKPASTTAGWQISWSLDLNALPAGPLNQMISFQTTSGYGWAINLDSGVYNTKIVDPDGTPVVDAVVGFTGTGEPNQWLTFRMKATQSGGTVTAEFAWFVQGAPTVWGVTYPFSGTIGALKSWSANGNASMQNGAMCQVFGVTTGTDNLQSYNALRAFDGYAGELAAARVQRLCQEAGVPVAIEAGTSEAMGVQPISGLLDLLRQCETADLGVLYEAGAGVGYRPRYARYNRAVSLALVISATGDVADAPEPTDDDQRIRNEWTVSRTGGSEATATDPVHIALNDRYPDQATLNILADDRLFDHASWRVHLGTWGEMRWPQIVVDLTDEPVLLTAWRGRPFGARITISGVPSQGPVGSDVDLIVEGWTEEITSHSWRVTLNCSPAKPWDVAVIDGSTSLLDSRSTTLGGSLSSSATTVALSTVNPKEVWAVSGGYDLRVDGEVIGVPAAGMSAASGTGPYTQTITGAVRSKNGIVKAHLTGAVISLAVQKFKAL